MCIRDRFKGQEGRKDIMAGKTGASSKSKKNSGNTRKTRTSGNAKQSSAKSAKASNKTQSNSSSSVTKRENTILTQLFPGILIPVSYTHLSFLGFSQLSVRIAYSVFNEHLSQGFLLGWSAWMDSNHRPRAYQARALTS